MKNGADHSIVREPLGARGDLDHRLRQAWTPDGADVALPSQALRWLAKRIGPLGEAAPVVPDSAIAVSPSKLPEQARIELAAVVGAAGVLLEPADRLARTGGLAYLDLLRRRSITLSASSPERLAVPDAVVLPATPEQVQDVLDSCVRQNIGVVPFGGGTSVVGGVTALRGSKTAVLVLDLQRLDRLISIDRESQLAVLQAGVRGPDAERLLGEHGMTLGHIPQSFERATIGGFAATRSAGQASAGYGRFEDMVHGVRLATPAGPWRLGGAPASAAGPDLRRLVLGSEGAFGVITEVTVRVRPRPAADRYLGFIVDGWERGRTIVRELAQRRTLADVTRLSDVDETEVSFALHGGMRTALLRRYLAARRIARPCLIVLGFEGTTVADIRHRLRRVRPILRAHQAISLGGAPGESWRRGRFGGPRQRDALLDNGVCVETLETAAHWSNLDTLRDRVRAALIGELSSGGNQPVVMCHISHAYETGASLYFTVLAARDDDDPIGQWERAKSAASSAITDDSLGTITHHHAVGIDHRPYLDNEIGAIGVDVLTAVKNRLDPTGILNPGKLIS